jgi:sugar fermentation stimulation protein A
MKFPTPLTRATLIRRYKRFLADVRLADGNIVVAHCANSGSMMGLQDEGNTVWLSTNTNPKAKLDWRWEMVEVDGHKVGINTARPNHIVEEAILGGTISELQGYETLRREVKYGGNSRIDILLSDYSLPGERAGTASPEQLCYVEVKNVTLKRGENAEFPDAVTARGTKHLNELTNMVADGHRAVMLYLINRPDCTAFTLAADIDPAYRQAFMKAREAGVEMLAYCSILDEKSIIVDKAVIVLA